MRLFHKKTYEEKTFEEKLKELCGGFLPNDAFLERAEKFGLKNEGNTHYKEILRYEFKKGTLKYEDLEKRLDELLKLDVKILCKIRWEGEDTSKYKNNDYINKWIKKKEEEKQIEKGKILHSASVETLEERTAVNHAAATGLLFATTGILAASTSKKLKWVPGTYLVYNDYYFKIKNKIIYFDRVIHYSITIDDGKYLYKIRIFNEVIVFRSHKQSVYNHFSKILHSTIMKKRASSEERMQKNEFKIEPNITEKKFNKNEGFGKDQKENDKNISKNNINTVIKNVKEKNNSTNTNDEENTISEEKYGELLAYAEFYGEELLENYQPPKKNEGFEKHQKENDKNISKNNINTVIKNVKEKNNSNINVKNSNKYNHFEIEYVDTIDLSMEAHDAMHKYSVIVFDIEDKAKNLTKEGNIGEAIKLYESIVNDYKFSGSYAYDQLIKYYYKQKDYENILRISNEYLENMCSMGYKYDNKILIEKKFSQTIPRVSENFEYWKTISEFNIKYPNGENNNDIGKIYEDQGNIDEAIIRYEENVKNGYPKKYPYTRLCYLYRKKKNYKKEQWVCNKAIKNLFSKEEKKWFRQRKVKVKEKLDKQKNKKAKKNKS